MISSRRFAIFLSIALLIGAGFAPSPAKAVNYTPMWVSTGIGGTHNLAYSNDGINWTGLGTSIFGCEGDGVAWNGTMWVAVGQCTNTIAYSYDGINWTGLGTSIFARGRGIAWNGTVWVAVAQDAVNTIAYSYDGINWTGLGNSIFTGRGWAVAWNGTMFVAVGNGTNTLAYSFDGINWTGLGAPVFSDGLSVAWNGSQWLAGGSGSTSTIAYSSNGLNWTGAGTSTFSSTLGFAWNGTLWAAAGAGSANSLAYSADGITWTGIGRSIFNQARGIAWNGSLFVAGGGGSGGSSLGYSSDGINWTGIGKTIFSAQMERVASAPAPTLTPSLALPHPVPTITSLSTSTAIFGDAGFTLTVTGTNFDASSTVQWNGVALSTTFVTSTTLTATVPSSKLGVVGPASVTVFAPTPQGGTSNAQSFNVQVLGSVSVGGGGGISVPASNGSGSSTPTSSSTIPASTDFDTALRDRIAELTALIANLQAQVAANGGATVGYKFNHDLKFGMTDADVRELQKYLNTHGFVLNESGPGSPGNETGTFGVLTLAAVIKFQEAHANEVLIPAGITNGKGTGFVGSLTRAVLNR